MAAAAARPDDHDLRIFRAGGSMQLYLRVRSFDMTLVIRAVYALHQALLCDEFFVPSLNLLCESLVRICQRSGVCALPLYKESARRGCGCVCHR